MKTYLLALILVCGLGTVAMARNVPFGKSMVNGFWVSTDTNKIEVGWLNFNNSTGSFTIPPEWFCQAYGHKWFAMYPGAKEHYFWTADDRFDLEQVCAICGKHRRSKSGRWQENP